MEHISANTRKKIIVLKYKMILYFKHRDLMRYVKSLKILSSHETVKEILDKGMSVSRFGDGEFYLMNGICNGFQKTDDKLSVRLKEVASVPLDNLLLCIPKSLQCFNYMRIESQDFALGFLLANVEKLVKPHFGDKRIYGDSLFTRFYMMKKHKKHLDSYVEQLKKIWDGRNILIIEGAGTRLGIGNDLFGNCKCIRRIICPDNNAFDKYDEIYRSALNHLSGDELVLISLGITATILAYDLCKEGYQALDIGHVDMEYEWMRMGAKEKCPVANKRMAEIAGGNISTACHDSEYLSQIVDSVI